MNALYLIALYGERRRGSLSEWCRRITGTPYGHVAVGDGEVALDHLVPSRPYFPFDRYVVFMPGVLAVVKLDGLRADSVLRANGLRTYESDPLRALARVLMHRRRDCVHETAGVMRRAGLHPPRSIVFPSELFDWAVAQGGQVVSMDRPPARDAH